MTLPDHNMRTPRSLLRMEAAQNPAAMAHRVFDLEAEVERLTRERDRAVEVRENANTISVRVEIENRRLKDQVERLRGLLSHFRVEDSDFIDDYEGGEPTDDIVVVVAMSRTRAREIRAALGNVVAVPMDPAVDGAAMPDASARGGESR